MKSCNHLICAALFLFMGNCTLNSANQFLSEKEILGYGKKYVELFYTAQLDSMFSKILDKNYKFSELKNFRNKVESQLGRRMEILNNQYGIEPWQNYYIEYARFEKAAQPVRTLFAFNNEGMILVYSVQVLPKEADSRFVNYQTKTNLSLPFNGEWFIAWGGRTINENQHIVSQEQRYAIDFLIRKGCKTFQGDGKSNSDYYCYEKKVIAPAAGTVVDILDSIDENSIGQVPQTHGNRVVIDHHNGEFSVLAHFKNGSIIVQIDDRVNQGQLLGLCGNTGASSEPHIHYHLQNSPDVDNGEGLPIQFHCLLMNKGLAEHCEPKIGDYVENCD